MKSFALCTLVLCSAIGIDAGVFSRRTGRNSPPLSSYGAVQVGSASTFNRVTSSFSGSGTSSFGGSGSSSFGGSGSTSFGGSGSTSFGGSGSSSFGGSGSSSFGGSGSSSFGGSGSSSFGGSGSSSFGGSSFGGSSSFGGASSGPAAPVVAIISETNNAPGTLGDNSDFNNAFEAENGIRQQAAGSTVTIGADSVVVMKGSYEYVGDDGQTYVVDWIADENGFQPSAPHLPKDVPIPFPEIAEAVAAQIAFAAQEDANGGSPTATGGFSGSSSSGFNSGFSQSFGASSQSQSVAPLSNYGR